MYAEVASVKQLSPSLVRVTLAGGTLNEFEPSSATDAYINARFIPNGSPLTVPFTDQDLESVSAEHRPRPRKFTIRAWNPTTQTLTIDFVVHGDSGYAGSWALHAKPGDRLQFQGPGGSYRPAPDVDWHLLAGDESAFGAIGASLEVLHPGDKAHVFAVVEQAGHEVDFVSNADVTITWLYRDNTDDMTSRLVDAVDNATLPGGTFDVFVHGKAAEVRALRKHLIADRNIDPDRASISPYWRRKHTDEQWRSTKRQWLTEQRADTARRPRGKWPAPDAQ